MMLSLPRATVLTPRRLLILSLLFFGTAGIALGAKTLDLTGDWAGAIHVPARTLHTALHIAGDASGQLSVTLDSLDQGAMGLPGANAVLQGNDFSFEIPSVHGKYKGTVSADGKTINGVWSQGTPVPLDFARDGNASAGHAISGDWSGAINVPEITLHLALHVIPDGDGFKVALDSLDQGAKGLPGGNVVLKGSNFSFDIPSVHGNYTGKVSADGKAIKGIWTQGSPVPLDFARQA